MNAGTPCPYDGLIGDEARAAWLAEGNTVEENVKPEEGMDETDKDTAVASGGIAGLLALLLLL